MLHRVLRGFGVVCLLWSAAAQAVSLGEMHVYSSPGEPLHADIELVEMGQVALDDVFPAFATEADLGVAGLKHNRYLSTVKLSVAVMEDGRPAVKLRSERPLFDTFLSFLLEIKWTGGRQLREYTALLKLTEEQRQIMEEYRQTMQQGAAVAVKPAAQQPSAQNVAISVEPSGAKAVNAVAVVTDKAEGRSIVVGERETLWDIAQRHRTPDGHSTQQFMLAVFDKNPHAFRNSDINGLVSGSRLVLPEANEVEAVSRGEALVELRRRLASSRLASRGSDEALVIEPGQTLWDLAARTRAVYGVDVRSMMDAIVKANPHAFADGDPDRMLKGVELKMPPLSRHNAQSDEVVSVSREAVVVAAQTSVAETGQSSVESTVGSTVEPKVEPKVIVIGRQDTLWSIAADSMPEGESALGAMIKAIIAKNPQAFVGGDMNTMKVGAVLSLPEWHEVQRYLENKPLNVR